MLRAVSAEAQEAVSPKLLETHRACPLAIEPDRIKIAMLNPRDGVALRELERHTGRTIEPWVTIEYRLYQALERYYRIRFDGLRSLTLAPPHEMRRQRLIADEEIESDRDDSAHEVDLQVGLDGLPLDAELPDAGIWGGEVTLPSAEPPSSDDGEAPAEAAQVEAPSAEPPATETAVATATVEDAPAEVRPPADADADAGGEDPFESLERRLSAGPDRDEIADVLLAYGAAQAPRVGVFAVGREGIRGITGRGRGFGGLGRIDLPRGGDTVLDAAIEGEGPYYGVVPHLPPNRELYSALGGQIPPSVLIVPVVVRDRTVAVLYMDNDGQPMTPPDDARLRRVAAKAGLAFEILILRNKLRSL
jgi:hypothetical protein